MEQAPIVVHDAPEYRNAEIEYFEGESLNVEEPEEPSGHTSIEWIDGSSLPFADNRAECEWEEVAAEKSNYTVTTPAEGLALLYEAKAPSVSELAVQSYPLLLEEAADEAPYPFERLKEEAAALRQLAAIFEEEAPEEPAIKAPIIEVIEVFKPEDESEEEAPEQPKQQNLPVEPKVTKNPIAARKPSADRKVGPSPSDPGKSIEDKEDKDDDKKPKLKDEARSDTKKIDEALPAAPRIERIERIVERTRIVLERVGSIAIKEVIKLLPPIVYTIKVPEIVIEEVETEVVHQETVLSIVRKPSDIRYVVVSNHQQPSVQRGDSVLQKTTLSDRLQKISGKGSPNRRKGYVLWHYLGRRALKAAG